ncbi:MAG: ABC transporter permease [Verrucomicrobiae bacterium]|nr:ABC transporter permease [Verrucomicrobiae bacterium]
MNDLRFSLRQLLKNPGFTAVAVLSLALGIAANTTIFSFVNTLLLRPPPVERPGDLWQIWQLRPKAASDLKRYGNWGPAEIAYLRQHNQSFADLGAFETEPSFMSWNLNGVGEPVQGLAVSGNFFDLCGIQPALGRFFLPAEDQTPGSHPVVVVSQAFWRNRLAADPQAVGRALTINGVALTVIGVAPDAFTGTMAGINPDLWVPFMMVPAVSHNATWLTRTDSHSVIGLGRLKPGVNEAQAGADLTALTHRFQEEIKGRKPEDGAVLTPFLMVPVPLRGFVRAFTATLTGAVLLVLLIACANAANLQLARGAARRKEMAVRSALGAGRSRLIRQLLTESVLLAAAGGGLGLLLSVWLANLIVGLVPTSLPLRLDMTPDWRVLTFTAVVSLATGILFGLAPAFRGTRQDVASALKDESRGTAGRRSRLANALIVGQMALCLVLLLGATLCLRSLFKARALDPGFEVKNRVTAGLNLNDFGYSAAQAEEFYARLLSRVQTLPGVRAAAWTRHLPLGTAMNNGSFPLDEQEPGAARSGFFERFGVGPGYFATLGTSLLQGREFTAADREGAPRVAIINEAAATRFWPGQNPIGRRLYVGDVNAENVREIVGVVQTGRYRTLGEDPKPAFFECFLQGVPLHATLVAHVRGDPRPVLAAIRGATQELDSRLALTTATTLEQHLTLALFPVRTSGMLLGVLGIVALVLAVSGLFGVIAYSVSQRTREVGIRMALGARRSDVQRLVLRQGMRLAGAGIVVGLPGALATTQWLRSLLFGISPTDPLTFLSIPLLLLAVAWSACWLPARRAARVDPMVALRAE